MTERQATELITMSDARAVLEDLCMDRGFDSMVNGCSLGYLVSWLADHGQWDPLAEALAREAGSSDQEIGKAHAIVATRRALPWSPLADAASDLLACLTTLRRPSEVTAAEREKAKRAYISAGKRIPRKWDQEWRLVEAKRVSRRLEQRTTTDAPYLDRLRLRRRDMLLQSALELAEEYHRTVRPLYRSAIGYIEPGSTGGEDISRDRYSKSWHNKYGPSRFRFAGVTVNPQGNAVLHPVTGNRVVLDLRAWRERREIRAPGS